MKIHSYGQATVEYIFILAFAVIFGFNVIAKYTDFFRDTMGGVSHVLSRNLTIGVCPKECWSRGYLNGFEGAE